MIEKVCAFCEAQGLLPRGVSVLIACSGGPDSLALLDLLWRVRQKYQLRLAAAHFEHGIRGEASKADAEFVRGFCEQRGIPFFLGSASVPQEMQKRGESLEKVARDLRYSFLRRIMKEHGYTRLALAHHADDQAETVLMRILRGTGTAGLVGMRPLTGDKIRPFLCVTKAEILAYCQERKLQPRHDATNDLPEGTRNILRLSLLPQLKKDFNPELSRALCQLAEVAAAEEDYLAAEIERLWQDATLVQRDEDTASVKLSQAAFGKLPLALQRALLRRFWLEVTQEGTDLGFVQAELLRKLLLHGTTGSQQELPHHYVAKLSYGWLSCCKAEQRHQLEQVHNKQGDGVPCIAPLQLGTTNFGAYHIVVTTVATQDVLQPVPRNYLYLPADELENNFCWRTRQSGDWMNLASGRKKLKKIFIDEKVPRALRDEIPLLADGEEILWLPEIRRSGRVSLDKRKGYPLYLQIIITK